MRDSDGSTNARAGAPAFAVVCAAGVETEYLRAGRGAPVVVLAHNPDDRWPVTLVERLAGEFLIIAPRVPDRVSFGPWLRGFLDGLGVGCVSIVTDARTASATLAFARSDETRVERIALFVGDTDHAVSLPHFLHDGAIHDA